MQISNRGIKLIQHFESCKKRTKEGTIIAYADPGHGWAVPTIGWGSIYHYDLDRKVQRGDVIDQETADRWLAIEIEEKCSAVLKLTGKCKINQDQLDALTSFAYNAGQGALARSSILRHLLAGNKEASAKSFLLWTKAAGKVLPGLVRRREAESALFLSDYATLKIKTHGDVG